MSKDQSRRTAIRLLAVSALALGLAACGGGGGNDNSTGAANGDLYAAFDLIGQGMTYEQVRDIVGFEYNNGKNDFGGGDIHYQWVADKGTANVSLLTVQFKNNRAVAKLVGGNKGTNSKFW